MDAMESLGKGQRTRAETTSRVTVRALHVRRLGFNFTQLCFLFAPIFLSGNEKQSRDPRAFAANPNRIAQSYGIGSCKIQEALRLGDNDRSNRMDRPIMHELPPQNVGDLAFIGRSTRRYPRDFGGRHACIGWHIASTGATSLRPVDI